jgi:hypothetical protein
MATGPLATPLRAVSAPRNGLLADVGIEHFHFGLVWAPNRARTSDVTGRSGIGEPGQVPGPEPWKRSGLLLRPRARRLHGGPFPPRQPPLLARERPRDTTNPAIIPAGPPSRASDPPSRKKTFLVDGSASRARFFYVPDINRPSSVAFFPVKLCQRVTTTSTYFGSSSRP